MIHGFLDRIEGDIAVTFWGDDESIALELPRALLPPEAREGDALKLSIEIDKAATAEARKKIDELYGALGDEP